MEKKYLIKKIKFQKKLVNTYIGSDLGDLRKFD